MSTTKKAAPVVNVLISAAEIIAAFKEVNPDFPVDLYLAGGKGAVLANTLRSLSHAGKKPRFGRRVSPVCIATCEGSHGETHEIRIGKDGNCYCTCASWRFQKLPAEHRTCKHINALFNIV
jgi:hypothetical protein